MLFILVVHLVAKGKLKSFFLLPFFVSRGSDTAMNKRKSSQASPEEDRIYTTRGSMGADETGKVLLENNVKSDKGTVVWPKLFLSLSIKEKEEDFMAMKGCKLPQRPKKRGKLIQRSVFVSLLIINIGLKINQ